MAEDAERNAEAIANALRRHAGNVIYPDYEPKDNFTPWLAGYKEKIRNASFVPRKFRQFIHSVKNLLRW